MSDRCPNPTYGRVLGSDLVGDLVTVMVTLAGAGAGAVIAAGTAEPAARSKRALMGALVGGGVGFVGSIFPNVYARRAILRGPDCPSPSVSRLFAYSLAKYGVGAAVGVGARAIDPKIAPGLSTAGTLALAPLVGREIIRT